MMVMRRVAAGVAGRVATVIEHGTSRPTTLAEATTVSPRAIWDAPPGNVYLGQSAARFDPDNDIDDPDVDVMETIAAGAPIHWDFRGFPHLFITGTTGGGKSNTAKVITAGLVTQGAMVVVLDPKMAGDYEFAQGAVSITLTREGWTKALGWGRETVVARNTELGNYRRGNPSASVDHYADLPGAGPSLVFVLDELTSIMTPSSWNREFVATWWDDLSEITRLGRSADVHVIALTQYGTIESAFGGNKNAAGGAIRQQLIARMCFDAVKENAIATLGVADLSPEVVTELRRGPKGRCGYTNLSADNAGVAKAGQILRLEDGPAHRLVGRAINRGVVPPTVDFDAVAAADPDLPPKQNNGRPPKQTRGDR